MFKLRANVLEKQQFLNLTNKSAINDELFITAFLHIWTKITMAKPCTLYVCNSEHLGKMLSSAASLCDSHEDFVFVQSSLISQLSYYLLNYT